MQIINILIALIVSIGFWNRKSKELDAKTAKASCTKTFILLLLSIAITFFYFKTYQVATIRNYISVNSLKGSFGTLTETFIHDDKEYSITRTIPYDRVTSLVLFNSFSHKRFNFFDPKRDLYQNGNRSGLEVTLQLDSRHDSIKTNYPFDFNIPSNIDKLKFCYDVFLMSNTIPLLYPLSVYEESINRDDLNNQDSISFTSYAKRMKKGNDDITEDMDKIFCTRLMSETWESDTTESTTSATLNTLNFFSAADLSQCKYQLIIRSSIPIDKLSVCFDIPIEVSSADINQNRLDSRDFSVEIVEKEDGTVDQFALYHIKFPTLSNLQLIRSLILTTLLTALYSLTFVNAYYIGRKKHKKYLLRHPLSYKSKKTMLLLWLPTGKILLWSYIALFSSALILLILEIPFTININHLIPVQILFILSLILYSICIILLMYWLHKKNIYCKDILQKIKIITKKLFCLRKTLHILLRKKG